MKFSGIFHPTNHNGVGLILQASSSPYNLILDINRPDVGKVSNYRTPWHLVLVQQIIRTLYLWLEKYQYTYDLRICGNNASKALSLSKSS